MDKRKGIWAQIIFIVFIGLVVSGIMDREMLDSLKALWDQSSPEVVLETISLGLGFLAMVLLLVLLVVRGIQDEDRPWDQGER